MQQAYIRPSSFQKHHSSKIFGSSKSTPFQHVIFLLVIQASITHLSTSNRIHFHDVASGYVKKKKYSTVSTMQQNLRQLLPPFTTLSLYDIRVKVLFLKNHQEKKTQFWIQRERIFHSFLKEQEQLWNLTALEKELTVIIEFLTLLSVQTSLSFE